MSWTSTDTNIWPSSHSALAGRVVVLLFHISQAPTDFEWNCQWVFRVYKTVHTSHWDCLMKTRIIKRRFISKQDKWNSITGSFLPGGTQANANLKLPMSWKHQTSAFKQQSFWSFDSIEMCCQVFFSSESFFWTTKGIVVWNCSTSELFVDWALISKNTFWIGSFLFLTL